MRTDKVRLGLKVFLLGVCLKVLTDHAYRDYRVIPTNFFPFIKKKMKKEEKWEERERERERKKNACREIFRIKGAQLSTFSDGNFDVHCDHGHLRQNENGRTLEYRL